VKQVRFGGPAGECNPYGKERVNTSLKDANATDWASAFEQVFVAQSAGSG
jgi:hypothetical protein